VRHRIQFFSRGDNLYDPNNPSLDPPGPVDVIIS